jgi:hypothetical protein
MAASPLGDAKLYTAAVERAYRSMWLQWCKKALLRKPA